MSYRIVNPESLGEPKGWNNGMLVPAGSRMLFIAGQVGIAGAEEAAEAPYESEMARQWSRAIANVLSVLRAAGGEPEHIGRMTVYVTDLPAYRAALKELGRVWRRHMGTHYPAMAVVGVSGLVDDAALVEIEATAMIPQ